MSALANLIGVVAVGGLALAGLSMWKGMKKGARVERRKKAELKKHQAQQARLQAEQDLVVRRQREKDAADQVEAKKADAKEELDRAAGTPDSDVGDALDDELGRP